MTPRTWLALALRVLGVMQLTDAATMLVQAYDIYMKVFTPQMSTVTGSLNYAVVKGAIGCFLILGAPFLSRVFAESDPPQS
jgi:hypothetical protein